MTRPKLGNNKVCPICKTEFYVKRCDWERLKTCSRKCRSIFLTGHKPYHWKGGRLKHKGYILILSKGHPKGDRDGYVPEHILVAEKKVGRILSKNEVVHHINGIRDDNRKSNLVVLRNQSEHFSYHKVWSSRKNIK